MDNVEIIPYLVNLLKLVKLLFSPLPRTTLDTFCIRTTSGSILFIRHLLLYFQSKFNTTNS